MLSLSHGSVLGFDFLGQRGAVVFKTSEQAVLNRLRCCSASTSGKNESRDRDSGGSTRRPKEARASVDMSLVTPVPPRADQIKKL